MRLPDAVLRTTDALMSTEKYSRLPQDTIEANVRLHQRLSEHNMSLKAYKSVKAGAVSIIIALLSWYAIQNGADPTATVIAAIAALLALNGVELSEWLAAKESLRQLDAQQGGDNSEK